MKNLINYYYNLLIGEFKRVEDCFLFEINNIKYEFIFFDFNIKSIEEIYFSLKNRGIYYHEIVLNRNDSMLTFYDNKPYILLKKHIYIEEQIKFKDIVKYDIPIYNQGIVNWKELWKNKIDYYEYQISQFGFKYKYLSETINYYIGLSESAISLLNFLDGEKVNFYICHRRINCNAIIDDMLNPLNIVFDNRTRDIGEFIKNKYINGIIGLNDIYDYLNSLDLNYNESLLLLARLMYPTYYFDLYDQIIQKKINEEKIEIYTKKNAHYESLLKKIYKYLKFKYKVPEIEWLEN